MPRDLNGIIINADAPFFEALGVEALLRAKPLLRLADGMSTSCVVRRFAADTKEIVLHPFLHKKVCEYYGKDFVGIFKVGEKYDLMNGVCKIGEFLLLGYA